MSETGLQLVETYVSLLHNKVFKFIATNLIMEICLVSERHTGSRLVNRWWEQDFLDLDGMWMAAQEAEQTEGEEDTECTMTETK